MAGWCREARGSSEFSARDVFAESNRGLFRFDDPISVEVGAGTDFRTFVVHGTCLTSRSLFFKKALSRDWREGEERLVKLPEDKSDTFELYLQCVYGLDMSVEPDPIPEDYSGHSERLELAKLYVFAEEVQDVRAQDTALKAFLNCVWKLQPDGKWCPPDGKTTRVLYHGTVPGSPMRKLLVDINAYVIGHSDHFKGRLSDAWPREFFIELSSELTSARLADSFKGRHLRYGDSADDYLEAEEEEIET